MRHRGSGSQWQPRSTTGGFSDDTCSAEHVGGRQVGDGLIAKN